jgi:hypothetical protein
MMEGVSSVMLCIGVEVEKNTLESMLSNGWF